MVCCSAPADGRPVVATGVLKRDTNSGVPLWSLKDAALCQLDRAPPVEAPPEPCAAPCGYALAASIRLPVGLQLSALRGYTARLCRNDECEETELTSLVGKRGHGPFCANAYRLPGGHPLQVRLASCEPGRWSLVMTYDARSDSVQDGDRYRLDVRTERQIPVVHWERRIEYERRAQPGAGPCAEARIGRLDCAQPDPAQCSGCNCSPGDSLCACL